MDKNFEGANINVNKCLRNSNTYYTKWDHDLINYMK
jgi:hypothetical protein